VADKTATEVPEVPERLDETESEPEESELKLNVTPTNQQPTQAPSKVQATIQET